MRGLGLIKFQPKQALHIFESIAIDRASTRLIDYRNWILSDFKLDWSGLNDFCFHL